MRIHLVLLVAVGLMQAACDDSSAPSDNRAPSTQGTLVIATSTGGGDPDPDGYLLTVDDLEPLSLDPSGTSEIQLRSGQHTVRLSGVAEHCSVTPGTSLQVDVPPEGTISVAFEVSCPASVVRITTTTTGLDLDPDGYRVVVNGTDREGIPANGTVLTRLDPGNLTVALTGLTPNCTIDGPDSRTVTVVASEVVSIEFAVVCTGTSGVVELMVLASGTDVEGEYWAMLDGARTLRVGPGGPHYLTGVSVGDHVISLLGPPNCSVETDPLPVTVTVGELIRDTVEIAFSITCAPQSSSGTVRITAPTTGPIPISTRYSVWYQSCGYWDYGGTSAFLGVLDPNGTLVAELPASGSDPTGGANYWYTFELRDLPANCRAADPHPYPAPGFTIPPGGTLEVEFAVACST